MRGGTDLIIKITCDADLRNKEGWGERSSLTIGECIDVYTIHTKREKDELRRETVNTIGAVWEAIGNAVRSVVEALEDLARKVINAVRKQAHAWRKYAISTTYGDLLEGWATFYGLRRRRYFWVWKESDARLRKRVLRRAIQAYHGKQFKPLEYKGRRRKGAK